MCESLDADPVSVDIADVSVEPEEVAIAGRRPLVTAWGWHDEQATQAVFDVCPRVCGPSSRPEGGRRRQRRRGGWVRSAATEDGALVGWGTVTGSGDTRAVKVVAEQPMPGSDPFPELTVSGGSLVIAEGVDAHRLRLHRLTSHGWLDPEAVQPEADEPA